MNRRRRLNGRRWKAANVPDPQSPAEDHGARSASDRLLEPFVVYHTPGIARALMHCGSSGNYILLTDIGGFDLPDPGGPFVAQQLSVDDRLISGPETLADRQQLVDWLRQRDPTFAAIDAAF